MLLTSPPRKLPRSCPIMSAPMEELLPLPMVPIISSRDGRGDVVPPLTACPLTSILANA
ncbi:MAG: hypothetical protein IJB52_12995 [Clostridia bacterium]|nr:hypothetical protein [Clostridia bacterium]